MFYSWLGPPSFLLLLANSGLACREPAAPFPSLTLEGPIFSGGSLLEAVAGVH